MVFEASRVLGISTTNIASQFRIFVHFFFVMQPFIIWLAAMYYTMIKD